MGSGTKVEKDDFKSVVKQFTKHWQTMANKIEDMIKTRQERVAENLEAAQLENSRIFQIDNELISSVDIPTNSTRSRTPFITLNSHGKCKHLEIESRNSSNNVEPLKDIVFLATSFTELTAILAIALRNSVNSIILVPPTPALPAPALPALA